MGGASAARDGISGAIAAQAGAEELSRGSHWCWAKSSSSDSYPSLI